MIAQSITSSRLAAGLFIALICYLLFLAIGYRIETTALRAEIEQVVRQTQQLSARLANLSQNKLPQIDNSIIWQVNETTSADQALQAWALTRLREEDQTIRQYSPGQLQTDIDAATTALKLEFSGSLSGLINFVGALENHRPALAIAQMQIRSLPLREQVDDRTMVAAQMTIWGITGVESD